MVVLGLKDPSPKAGEFELTPTGVYLRVLLSYAIPFLALISDSLDLLYSRNCLSLVSGTVYHQKVMSWVRLKHRYPLWKWYSTAAHQCNNFPGSVIPEGMSTMSNKYSMITFTINKTVTENWSTKVQKQRNSAATFIHFITEFTTS